MKKIADERLQLVQLKNIRIAFIVQTIGIVLVLAYDFIKIGIEGMTANPLWFVLILSVTVLLYLSMGIAVDYEKSGKSRKKSLIVSLTILFLISLIVLILTSLTDGYNMMNGLLFASLIFMTGLIPIIYLYILRKE